MQRLHDAYSSTNHFICNSAIIKYKWQDKAPFIVSEQNIKTILLASTHIHYAKGTDFINYSKEKKLESTFYAKRCKKYTSPGRKKNVNNERQITDPTHILCTEFNENVVLVHNSLTVQSEQAL